MIQFHSFALYGQEVEIGIVLVLRHAKNLPPFQVQNEFSMTEVHFTSSFILKMVSKLDL